MATPAERVPDLHTHPLISSEVCELCEQTIPPERVAEVRGRMAARDLARSNEITARLREQFARERSDDATRFEAQLQAVRAEEGAARERLLAEGREREAVIRGEATRALDAERQRAQESRAALAADLERERGERDAAVEAAQRAGEALAAAAREEATQAAQVQVRDAQQRAAEAERRVEALRLASQSERAAAVAEVTAQLAKTEEQRAELERTSRDAHQALQALKDEQATVLQHRLQEQREVLTKEKDKAILETEARTFAERQKLQGTVQDLTRQLEKMSAQDRGEGAEIDLFEALKGAFEGDRIRRVKKGLAGPDIIHEIVRHGKVCGTIVYETKNRNDYKSAYATKLRADQMAAKAEFAVLSSNHFPADVRQLHLHHGVIVACPARVVTIAQILRRHLLQMHELRVSAEERDAKTEALYRFITSEQCRQILETVDRLVAEMMELDVSEQKAHKAVWEKRGRMLASVLKAHGDLCGHFDRIIGTAD